MRNGDIEREETPSPFTPTPQQGDELPAHRGSNVAPDQELSTAFRQSMRRHASGVCILTVGRGETVGGMVVTSATSFSFDPPSVLVCVNKSASILAQLAIGSRFGLSVLIRDQDVVAEACSRSSSGRSRFDVGAWDFSADRPPVLEGAQANLIGVVEASLAYGSHLALVGRVERVQLGADSGSLIYRNGSCE